MDFISHQAEKILACYTDSSLNSCINKAEENDIEKGGEGARGGKVVGHTKSGKAIYESTSRAHSNKQHADFTEQDHQDAATQHFAKWSEHKKAGEHDEARKSINHVGWHNDEGEKKRKATKKAAAPDKKAYESEERIDRYRSDMESANMGDLDKDEVQKKHTKRTKETHKEEIASGKSKRIGELYPDSGYSGDQTEIHQTSDGQHHFYNPDSDEYRTLRKSKENTEEEIED